MKSMLTPNLNIRFSLRLALCLPLLMMGCSRSSEDAQPLRRSFKASVTDGGLTVRIPVGSPGLEQISTVVAHKGSTLISVFAPARVVASISRAVTSREHIVLFESADVTSLYSQYRQARANVRLTDDNLVRVRDMYANQGVTARDLNQAENDAANAHASMAEMEGRLRALGFNPVDLEADTTARVWLISDVPETQLHEVQKGEDVDVVFSGIPDKKFVGTADAIGEVIDPVTRTVKVRVSLPNPARRFLPGMFAHVDFGDPISGVVVLPNTSVVTVNSQDYVFVQPVIGEFHRRPVTIVSSSGKEIVVLKGLEDGETVVTQGAMLLKGLSFGF